MADFQGIATQFVAHYYTTFDSDRKALASLYRNDSKMTFESDQLAGGGPITEKLANLPFQKVLHKYGGVDAQPTATGAIVILVTGQLVVDDSTAPLSYSQTFVLGQDATGGWYVQNDIFKLVVF
ncbi:nuclear transport factor 2 [Schizothecium vesticola]|uniref:Nuclear transport factor 2 n=1 Tax=Schizothecium vesticola TaxID=314040 RepID=A0AA40K2V0_9PEZI|nr:nuclear transport factor 2 [Schizothecium vesticola]